MHLTLRLEVGDKILSGFGLKMGNVLDLYRPLYTCAKELERWRRVACEERLATHGCKISSATMDNSITIVERQHSNDDLITLEDYDLEACFA